jgi:hypothetical protein
VYWAENFGKSASRQWCSRLAERVQSSPMSTEVLGLSAALGCLLKFFDPRKSKPVILRHCCFVGLVSLYWF